MYIARNDKVWTAPLGSEFLGWSEAGEPMVFYRGGWIGPMVETTGLFRRPKETEK